MDKESELIATAMRRSPRIIAVDLDGTLASQEKGWRGYAYIGKPIMSVIKDLRKEKRKGAKTILHTCRVTTLDNRVNEESLATIRAWLHKYKVPIDEIWMGTGKPYAAEYWDDKAVKKP